MRVTIKDIAQKLNLNYSSVSKALNNKPGVSEKTRQLVVETAKELGYRPNVIAQGLVSKSTRTIGVIVPEIQNPIFGAITTGIIETAKEAGYDVFLCITNWSEEIQAEYIHTVQQKRVDGIIIMNAMVENYRLLEEADVPVIGYEAETWSTNYRFSSVSTDNEKGGYIAAKHLLDYGYRKTALLQGPEDSNSGKYRRAGFAYAYKEAKRELDDSLIYFGEYNIKSGYALSQKILKEHPDIDSIFAGNDVMALGILQGLTEAGREVGKDIGVIGFDNINLAHLPQIQLTTVKQPKYSIGRISTKLLFAEIKTQNEGGEIFPQRIILEPELIIRNTTVKRS